MWKKKFLEWLQITPLLLLIGVLSVASWAFAIRTMSRNGGGYVTRMRSEVASNWGSSVKQMSPNMNAQLEYDAAQYKDKEEYEAEQRVVAKSVKVIKSDVNVSLGMDHRRKGLTYFPTYVTDFSGTYRVKNDSKKQVTAQLQFPLPAAGNLVWNVEVVANGSTEGSVITSNELSWNGKMMAGEEKEIVVKYSARGLEDFTYSLAESKGLQDFNFNVKVKGADRIDFPKGALSPVRAIEDKANQSWDLGWQFNRVLASPNITVRLYSKENISDQVAKLFWVVPFLLVGYLAVVWGLAFVRGKQLNWFDGMLLSTLYVIFYPLLAYIVSVFDSLDLMRGLAIAAGVVGLIVVYYFQFLFGVGFALSMGLLVLGIFMGFFPVAMLIPQLTGLLVIGGIIVILATVVQLRVGYGKK